MRVKRGGGGERGAVRASERNTSCAGRCRACAFPAPLAQVNNESEQIQGRQAGFIARHEPAGSSEGIKNT